MKTPIDVTSIYKKYKGQWVALEGPNKIKVVASGKDLKTVLQRATIKGFKTPFMMQVPKKVLPIVGPYKLQ